MKYNFDEVIDRTGTSSLKWDCMERRFGRSDLLPMWVADMDFRAPLPVIDAVAEKARSGLYGYTEVAGDYYRALTGWLERRHGWKVDPQWICFSPGVMPALHWLVKTFTHPGDKVILQSPVYPPFFEAIKNGGCHVVNNQLQLQEGNYEMDLELLERQIDRRVKMLFLCNPHNPGGRIWNAAELRRLGEICLERQILLVSDEIHSDLILKGHTFNNYASLGEEYAMHSFTCIAPSKTFNLAGLQLANVIIPNPRLANDFKNSLEKNSILRPNLFALAAAEAAYRLGDDWLDQLLAYLEQNQRLLEQYVTEHLSPLRVIRPQATYLAWLDCRGLGLTPQDLRKLFEDGAGLALSHGYTYGPGGEGFVRINLGCPRSVVAEALERIRKALDAFR